MSITQELLVSIRKVVPVWIGNGSLPRSEACYDWMYNDRINVTEHYVLPYVLLHEATHATGHRTRLCRPWMDLTTEQAYAGEIDTNYFLVSQRPPDDLVIRWPQEVFDKEEAIAHTTATRLCSWLGVGYRLGFPVDVTPYWAYYDAVSAKYEDEVQEYVNGAMEYLGGLL